MGILQKFLSYIKPESNGGVNFWSSPAAQALVKVQQFNQNAPHVSWSENVSNPIAKFAVGIPESIVNIPHDLLSSGSQLGTDIRTGQITQPRVLASDVAGAALPLLNLYTLGSAGGALNNLGEQTFGQALKQGALTGAKYGTGFGFLGGLQSGRDITNPYQYAGNLALNTGVGGIAGAGLGATLEGVGYGFSKLRAPSGILEKTPRKINSQEEASQAMNDLLWYAQDLQQRGYNANQIDKISVSSYQKIRENNLSPSQYFTGGTKKYGKSFGDMFDEVKTWFQPLASDTKDLQYQLREKRGTFDLTRDNSYRSSEKAIQWWDQFKPEDRLDFITKMEAGGKQDTPQLQTLATAFRNRFNADYELARSIKNIPYRPEYFSHAGVWENPEAAAKFYEKTLSGKTAAFGERKVPTIMDGINFGLKVKETNPETIALTNHIQLLKAKMADDFLTEAKASGADMTKVQAVVDRALEPGLEGSAIFRNIRTANNALNQMNLALSGFHATDTAINAQASKLALGLNQLTSGHPVQAVGSLLRTPTAPFEYLLSGSKIMKEAEAGKLTPAVENIIGGGGRIGTPEIYKNNGFTAAIQSFKDKPSIGGAVNIPLGILEDLQKPIMEKWVPALKAGAAEDLIKNKLRNAGDRLTPELERKIRSEAIDSIDNRFGQLNYDNLFWNKTLRDLSQVSMRSAGWNIGTVRELGQGFFSPSVALVLAGEGLTNQTSFTIALPIVVGTIGAVYQYLHTGKGPQEAIDYMFPKTGQVDKNGKEERVSLPTYMKDVFSLVHDPFQTAANKASPVISEAYRLATNKDYYGNQIRDPNMPWNYQAGQVGAHLVTSALPFSIQSGANRLSPSLETKAEAVLGINKAPAFMTGGYYATKTELDKKLNPDQKRVADFLTEAKSKGGPTAAQRAQMLMDQPWLFDYYKTLQQTSDPQGTLWSLPDQKIKLYLAYQATSDVKVKAQIRILWPEITQLQTKLSDEAVAGIQDSYQTALANQNTPANLVKKYFGVAPTLTVPDITERKSPPYNSLPVWAQKIVSAYTALPDGSPQRKALLAQNPWLKTYWDANQAFYSANPVNQGGALADFLAASGINPNPQQQTPYTPYPKKPAIKSVTPKAFSKSKKVTMPKLKATKIPKLKLAARVKNFKPLKPLTYKGAKLPGLKTISSYSKIKTTYV